MNQPIILRSGGTELQSIPQVRVAGTARRATTLVVNDGESLGSITRRAYGYNSPEGRARILAANARLEGTINVPR